MPKFRQLLGSANLFGVVVMALVAAGNESPSSIAPVTSVLTNLVFDAETKQYEAKPTDAGAPFIFNVTNVWTNELTIDRVQTSCGCTVASLPSNPWHLAPNLGGAVKAKIDLTGKPPGLITKTLTFYCSTNGVEAGTRVITVKANIPDEKPTKPGAMSETERKMAMEKAKADPQEIFKNPKCAECHVNQGLHLHDGAALYAADCGICHDSPNRASSVPDLHKMTFPQGFEYWKRIIADGKTNTMMPAFVIRNGGPLSDEQASQLAAYMSFTFKNTTPSSKP